MTPASTRLRPRMLIAVIVTVIVRLEPISTHESQNELNFLRQHSPPYQHNHKSGDESLAGRQNNCDMDLCDHLVNICTSTQRCQCDSKGDARCAKDCIDCLEENFGSCCACVGLCPPTQADSSHASHVGKTCDEPDSQLFQVLTETDDIHGRWSVATKTSSRFISKALDLNEHSSLNFASLHNLFDDTKSNDSSHSALERVENECTVAFINRDLSTARCKRHCTSMGANAFRWFENGCCECVGERCFDYGIEEPRCQMN